MLQVVDIGICDAQVAINSDRRLRFFVHVQPPFRPEFTSVWSPQVLVPVTRGNSFKLCSSYVDVDREANSQVVSDHRDEHGYSCGNMQLIIHLSRNTNDGFRERQYIFFLGHTWDFEYAWIDSQDFLCGAGLVLVDRQALDEPLRQQASTAWHRNRSR